MSDVPTGETIERAVLLAGRAPSLHNSQPWRWVFDGTALQLFSVPERLLHATDTGGRQLLISCGIVLGHLDAALAAAGWRSRIAFLPNPTRPDQLATVTFARAEIVTDADRDRAAAITRRHTDRLPYAPPPGWDDFELVLRTVVAPEDATLAILPDTARAELAHAARLSAVLRRYDSSYQAELHWWTGHSFSTTGVPAEALTSAGEQTRVGVGRALPTVDGPPRRTELPADRSVILALSTDGDSRAELVRCGVALSTVLLEATVAGYATCPLTHITELPRARSVVGTLTGNTARPQVLVRVGVAPTEGETPAATPRLPLSEILTVLPAGPRH